MSEERTYRVAEIFNDREIALAGGTADGLNVDDVLRIVSPDAHEIRDPETNEVLGEIVHTKAVVRVYEVKERFALARTFRTRRVNVGGSSAFSGFGNIFEAPKYETKVETLRRDRTKGSPINEVDSIVSVGDLAEKVDSFEDIPSFTIWQ